MYNPFNHLKAFCWLRWNNTGERRVVRRGKHGEKNYKGHLGVS